MLENQELVVGTWEHALWGGRPCGRAWAKGLPDWRRCRLLPSWLGKGVTKVWGSWKREPAVGSAVSGSLGWGEAGDQAPKEGEASAGHGAVGGGAAQRAPTRLRRGPRGCRGGGEYTHSPWLACPAEGLPKVCALPPLPLTRRSHTRQAQYPQRRAPPQPHSSAGGLEGAWLGVRALCALHCVRNRGGGENLLPCGPFAQPVPHTHGRGPGTLLQQGELELCPGGRRGRYTRTLVAKVPGAPEQTAAGRGLRLPGLGPPAGTPTWQVHSVSPALLMHSAIGLRAAHVALPAPLPVPRAGGCTRPVHLGETGLQAGLPGGREGLCLGLPAGPRGCSQPGSPWAQWGPCAMDMTHNT